MLGGRAQALAAARDRAGGGLAFADEDHRALALFLLLVGMILAVLQLRDAQRDRLGGGPSPIGLERGWGVRCARASSRSAIPSATPECL